MPRSKTLWLVLAGLGALCHPSWAESQRTVSELIQTIKAQKEKALEPQLAPTAPHQATRAVAATPRPARTAIAPLRPAETPAPAPRIAPVVKSEVWPQVWSLGGVNGNYSASLLIERRIHWIDGESLPQEVAGWMVLSISARDVCISRQDQRRCLQTPSAYKPPVTAALATVPGPKADSVSSNGGLQE